MTPVYCAGVRYLVVHWLDNQQYDAAESSNSEFDQEVVDSSLQTLDSAGVEIQSAGAKFEQVDGDQMMVLVGKKEVAQVIGAALYLRNFLQMRAFLQEKRTEQKYQNLNFLVRLTRKRIQSQVDEKANDAVG